MEIGLLSHLISKDDGVLREWLVRKKLDYTFIDVIASKGRVQVDYKKDNLLRAVKELINQGFRITELNSNRDSDRNDLMVTLQKIPGSVTKGMKASHIYKEVYSFDYGKPVGESNKRKRQRSSTEAASTEINTKLRESQSIEEDSGENDYKASKLIGHLSSNDEEEAPSIIHSPTAECSGTRILSKIKLSNRMKKIRRRRAYRRRQQEEQKARECATVTKQLAHLEIKVQENGASKNDVVCNEDTKDKQSTEGVIQSKEHMSSEQTIGKVDKEISNWDELNFDLPYSSDDDKDFSDTLSTWEEHKEHSNTLAGLGFAVPLPVSDNKCTAMPIPIPPERQGYVSGPEIKVDCVAHPVQDIKLNTEPAQNYDLQDQELVGASVNGGLADAIKDIDLESKVRDWFELTSDEEAKLLDGSDGSDEELPHMTWEELDEALARELKDMDDRLLQSLDESLYKVILILSITFSALRLNDVSGRRAGTNRVQVGR